MASKLQAARGMPDLLAPDSAKWRFFEKAACSLFERYGYREVRTPLVEPTELFSRGIGEATDIVEKEMYTFRDRKDRSLTLRPEGTASCVRAYIQHSIGKREPVTRWYYSGPMYRYERMQVGRYRQFYQIGVEVFGIKEPTIEAEQIAMLCQLYKGLGIPGLRVVINSVGGSEDRPAYRKALIEFLEPKASGLCDDCKRRLGTNPLRILDCKVPGCKAIVVDAPSVLDHLSEASATSFAGTQEALDALGVDYEVDPRMVRGLDYYTGTVFEIISNSDALGTQSTIVAGGRYDNLVSSLGGPDTPGVGFALGVERNVMSLPGEADDFAANPLLFIASRGQAAQAKALALASSLRGAGFYVATELRTVGLKSQFKRADKLGARYAITLGDDELAAGKATIRDLRAERGSGGDEIALDGLAEYLRTQTLPTPSPS